MEVIIRSLILSWMMAVSCKAFFDTLLPGRQFPHLWIKYTSVPAFFAGFLIIAFTEIPPYLLQPVRLILVVSFVVLLYYRAGILKNLTTSVLFCETYWLASVFAVAAVFAFPFPQSGLFMDWMQEIIECIHLLLILFFYFRCKNHLPDLTDGHWTKFGLSALSGLILIVSISLISWDGNPADGRAILAVILSFVAISVCVLCFIADMLKKEKEMQKLRLIHERTLSQMNRYHSMQKNYEQQRKYFHDYKNQLSCIQGLLENGKITESLEYISSLTGTIRKSAEYVNTNHTVVNTILNQKYQEACEKGITMSMTVNDLSTLSMREEQIVSLLGNLLDNAIEACLRPEQDSGKLIQFRMVLEEGQLILSTRNPVKEPVQIKNNRIHTQKSDTGQHGIGLLNVDSIIRSCNGTSVLKCEDGWFCFSAMIPLS